MLPVDERMALSFHDSRLADRTLPPSEYGIRTEDWSAVPGALPPLALLQH